MLSIPKLADHLGGRVIAPGDPDYDQARTVFPGGIDRRPALIARVADAADVSRVIALARDSGVPLSVRSGGHSPAGHGVNDDGIVLDLTDMKALEIDPERRTAWAETGLSAGEYTIAAGAHGLATGFGDTGSVGIGGITLGGGVGFLVRKYGLTIDDLLAAEVVTADGEVLHVDPENHEDLFWAIRGGGGNFGVATRFQFRLHELDTIVGGMLVLPAEPSVVASLIAESQAAPEELSGIVNVMTAPPMPFLPPEVHGRLIALVLLAYAGPPEEGEPVIARLRGVATPLADMVRPMPYPEIYQPDPEDYHPLTVGRTIFMDGFDEQTAEKIIKRIQASTAQTAATQLRVLGGAAARVSADATAYAHRDKPIMANVATIYGSPEERSTHAEWAAALARELQTADGAAYAGFLADEGEERVRNAYPGSTWDRLAKIKARYDPGNLFRLNQNVPPA
jgi:FAD binding domain/Berberine and berberine like